MNNVEEFYKRKELLDTVKSLTINRDMIWVSNEGDHLVIKFNNDLNPVLEAQDKRDLLDIIKDEIIEKREGIAEYTIEKLTKSMECSKKKVIEDLDLIGKE